MTTLDLFIAGVVALAAYSGFRSGLVAGTWGLVAWASGLLGADAAQARLAPVLAPSLGAFFLLGPALAFGVTLLVAEALLALASRFLIAPLRALVRANGVTGALDRIFGLVPGVARGLLVSAVAITLARALPLDQALRASIDGSTIARMLVAGADVGRSLVQP